MTSGGEEVWDFMRLDMGQWAVDPRVSVRSTGGQLHAPCRAIFPKIAQNEPKMPQMCLKFPKMSLKCPKGRYNVSKNAPRAQKVPKGSLWAKFVLKRVPRDPFRSNLVRF